jgi:hypothetical protein
MAVLRRRTLRINPGPNTVGKLNELAERMNALSRKIAKLQEARLELEVQAVAYMKADNLLMYPTPFGTHYYEAKKGRAQRTIDIAKFRALVSKTEFEECISVNVSKASKLLTKAALEKLSSWTTPEAGPPVYSFEPAGVGGKKK